MSIYGGLSTRTKQKQKPSLDMSKSMMYLAKSPQPLRKVHDRQYGIKIWCNKDLLEVSKSNMHNQKSS